MAWAPDIGPAVDQQSLARCAKSNEVLVGFALGGRIMTQFFDEIPRFTSAEYAAALREVEPRLSAKQRSMLVAHATTQGCRMTMKELANAAGAAGPKATHSLYGVLGQMLAEALGYHGK